MNEGYPASALLRVRVNGEDVTALYVRTVQGGLSVALLACLTCSSVLKQECSPKRRRDRTTLAVREKSPRACFKWRDNRLAIQLSTFQMSELLE